MKTSQHLAEVRTRV